MAIRALLVNNLAAGGDEWAKRARGKHLEPGVVRYQQDDGTEKTYLLPRETIARMRPTATGKPIVGKTGGFDHRSVKPNEKHDGYVFESLDGGDGWECIDFLVSDQETARACREGYQLSCAYVPTETDGKPGLWHNVPYDETILDGVYTHFAVVPNPRYEGAEIELVNSKDGGNIVNKVLKAALALVPLKDLREVFNSIEEDEKKKEKKNAALVKAKADYENAMKNAKTDEEKAKAKEDLEKANAAAEAEGDPKSPLPEVKAEPQLEPKPGEVHNDPKPAIGGGDLPPEPGLPGQAQAKPAPAAEPAKEAPKANAEETPEQKAAREKTEHEQAYNAEVGKAFDEHAEKLEMSADAVRDAAGKLLPHEKQNSKVQAAWRVIYDKASGKGAEEKRNSLTAAIATATERKNAEAEAKRKREERFNALRAAATERGGSSGTPFVGVVTLEEKQDLGRERYGS